jgi:hypothetical protein
VVGHRQVRGSNAVYREKSGMPEPMVSGPRRAHGPRSPHLATLELRLEAIRRPELHEELTRFSVAEPAG